MRKYILNKNTNSLFKKYLGILRFFSENNSKTDNFSYLKVNDLKNFGKKFNDEEVKKYLDPFGFLNSNECILY